MPPWARRVLVLAAGVVGVASVGLVLSADTPTTYAATSASLAVATAVAGLLLVGAGGVQTWTGRGGSSGPAVLALGLVWWAPVWVGWDDGSALARSVAMVAVPFAPALLLHLAESLPAGTVPSRPLRLAVGAAYGVATAYSLTRAAVRDPFLDLFCWSNCSDNVFLVAPEPGLARLLEAVGIAAGGLTAVAAAVVALGRLAATSPVGRRTRAQMLASVQQLRESRMRVVVAADAARRGLERDLHDGAQQRLLALTLQLTIAAERARAAGESDRAEQLERAVEQARVAVAELRRLAHGIYPAVLDQAGLDGALRALAESASLPVSVEPHPVPDSVPPAAARVLYLAAREATQQRSTAGMGTVRLAVARTPGSVVLEVAPGFTPSTGLDDRVGAIGGSLGSSSGMLRLEVPCE